MVLQKLYKTHVQYRERNMIKITEDGKESIDKEFEITNGRCDECILNGIRDGNCVAAFRIITGKECNRTEIILKEKEKFETCSRENTRVGDIVIDNSTGYKYKIKYISDQDFLCPNECYHNCIAIYHCNSEYGYQFKPFSANLDIFQIKV